MVQVGVPSKDSVLDWSRQRLPRILADHLLRSGYLETAALLSETAHLQASMNSEACDPSFCGLRD